MPNHFDGKTPEQRFWDKVLPPDADGCWIWNGAIQGKYYKSPGGGYGSFRWNGKVTPAHRVAWMLLHGEIPDGLHVDHLCRRTRCVNPKHMELVTNAENHRRGIGNKGEHHLAKTHCPKGHEYTDENIYWMRKRKRIGAQWYRACRTCRLETYKRYDQKRRRKSHGPA